MPDIWNGKELPSRNSVHEPLSEDIHYRLYDQNTGRLLSFNSTNSLGAVAGDIADTQREHPAAKVVFVRYDGPAYR
ncbi:hypothetical protein [Streptomyces capitiformicae]|uniref:Uncharacterized protein n=1 Tax=Streptomyces capitiformicae TaxID=2014920 RepID=A0A919L7K3_9ACTN|nr:hypothetical protein [Streptomyces capitiformicae]GHH87835.1 hypothetical protein GCM10017771_30650 [Streptomyces capitiformicae]